MKGKNKYRRADFDVDIRVQLELEFALAEFEHGRVVGGVVLAPLSLKDTDMLRRMVDRKVKSLLYNCYTIGEDRSKMKERNSTSVV